MKCLFPFNLSRIEISDDHLRWRKVEVQGRPAEFGQGGADGPPVLFLHGWGLGSHAYKRAIKRLLSRGCRVYAPAMPSFGRTAGLPGPAMDLEGYGAWVSDFLDAVGVQGPVMVIGHSFGGGVGIKLAESRPDLVGYLVLLNAVGGVAPRPIWSWAGGFLSEMWPIPQGVEMARAVSSDLIPNLVRNPLGMLRVARLAQTADLREEAAGLRSAGVPVLVLTSERDSVIPRTAFDALCSAIGSEGRVVSGRHSWMLADPDSFGAALSALVDVRVAEHRTGAAAGRAEEVTDLLRQTKMQKRSVNTLVRNAPPLWLMSETAEVLAGDLALCHPRLGHGEVRAVARPIEGSLALRLTVVAKDRRGLLADSAAVLAAHRLSITHASAATWSKSGLALHSFVIHGGRKLDRSEWERLGQALRALGKPGAARPTSPPRLPYLDVSHVAVHGEGGDQMMVTVTARDGVGVLAALCRRFADLDANIESLQARTGSGMATDTFLLACSSDCIEADRFQRAFGAA